MFHVDLSYKQKSGGLNPFCGAKVNPDFGLLVTSAQGFTKRVDSLLIQP